MEDAFGSVEQFWLMRLISLAMQQQYVPFSGADDWRRSPEHFEVMLKTVNGILESMRPAPMSETSPIEKEMMDFTSKNLPIALWKAITEADESLRLDQGTNDDHLAAMLKRKIGKVAEGALKNAQKAMPSEEEWKLRRDAAYAEQHKSMSETGKRRKK
ncbi:hypothetical protein [Methylobacterium pseudosasicola]|nr:hypothetical protein [Methylobacterium pseudosasicola]